ncbi:MAG: radical SAM protein [Atopobiaceae bacterium]
MATFLNPAYVYGPVHSRRLGVSLGINMNPAEGKHCTFDCVYCELGTNEQRRTSVGFPAAADIVEAVRQKLEQLAGQGVVPDVLTMAGNGEPTANPEFPQVVDGILALRDRLCPNAKVAVLSNSTFAHVPAVHDALMRVDDNILKLDTVDPEFIARVDRPVGAYDVKKVVDTLASFGGHVIVQTIFLRGEVDGRSVDNTSDAYVEPWLGALRRIGPQAVTVYTIARDTPYPGLRKATHQQIDDICQRVRQLGIRCTASY